MDVDALVESNNIARSTTFAPVKLSRTFASGTLVKARVVSVDARFAYAEAA
jgi:hypothetical protein